MALGAALHHSAGPSKKKVVERREEQEEEVHETHVALRGLKTPPLGTPQVRLEAAARASVDACRPLHCLYWRGGQARPSAVVRCPLSSSSSWRRGTRAQ